MPRATTKAELLAQSTENYKKLLAFIDSLSDEKQLAEFPKGTLNRKVSDVLAHLHEWNLMALAWYEIGIKGEKPVMPAEGYTWKDLPELNIKIWEKYHEVSLSKVRPWFQDSFNALQKVIKSHTDEELFTKKKYKWTGSTSMGAYFISATSSHYAWALKLIKKAMK